MTHYRLRGPDIGVTASSTSWNQAEDGLYSLLIKEVYGSRENHSSFYYSNWHFTKLTAIIIIVSSLFVLFQTASEATSLEVTKRSHPKFVCLYVCLSVFYLLLDHWRDQNETFRGHKHQPLDGYYILKTYCYLINFKVICEKPVSRLILVAHIHTHLAQETPSSTPYLPFYLLPPFLPSTSLLPPYLPHTSLSTSYLPFYLLFLPHTS